MVNRLWCRRPRCLWRQLGLAVLQSMADHHILLVSLVSCRPTTENSKSLRLVSILLMLNFPVSLRNPNLILFAHRILKQCNL
jgi:hypothetical protein